MRWMLVSLTGALSFSRTFASIDPLLGTKYNLDPRAHLYATDEKEYVVPQPIGQRNVTTSNVFSRFLHHLDPRQETGRCGPDGGNQRCPGSQCCSSYGYCGTDFEHCGELVGCQPAFGQCGDQPPPPPPTTTPTPTLTPTPTPLPPTTSVGGPSSSSLLPPLPSGTLILSTNGQCGNVTTCAGSVFGRCCSEFYFCGNSIDFCGSGCRSGFGACGGGSPPLPSSSAPVPSVPSSSSMPPPTTTPTPIPTPIPTPTAAPVPTNVSTNGRCGAEGNGVTCQGSTYGRCCSDYGWCGSGDEFCRPSWGCRPEFGTCG